MGKNCRKKRKEKNDVIILESKQQQQQKNETVLKGMQRSVSRKQKFT